MSKPVLDIIVTRKDEPWSVCKLFFEMLEMQQCVDFNDIRVIFVDMDDSINYSVTLSKYSYEVIHTYLDDYASVADARNAGLKNATAPWVMFCNIDDMLSDVCSMSQYLENIPTDDYDIIWSRMVRQCRWYTGRLYLNKVDGPDFANTDGKLYNREFLVSKNITFPNDKYYYDYIFNNIVLAESAPFRIAALTTDFYPYYKRYRIGTLRHTVVSAMNMLDSVLKRDIYIIEELDRRGLKWEYHNAIIRALCRQYYAIFQESEGTDNVLVFGDALKDFYRKYFSIIKNFPATDVDPIRTEVEMEVVNIIQSMYNEHNLEFYLVNDRRTFDEWLAKLDSQTFPVPDVPVSFGGETVKYIEPQEDIQPTEPDPHVVVYCGTYNVYLNMVASLKSLLCTTPVDKVYFLIEDDEFPYEIPDIVECINVKNQTFFPKNGPNYNNSWTYMCMMRAIYPELFSQYKKILSLDIDVVINDDVSDLWDYDLSQVYLAGVPEPQRKTTSSSPDYINFGVVMMNLEKLREDHKQEQIINMLNTKKIDCPEQGAYNRACAYQILPLPADYNYTAYSHITGDAERQRIIHYAGQKFWRCYQLVKQYSDLSWPEIIERQAKLHENH